MPERGKLRKLFDSTKLMCDAFLQSFLILVSSPLVSPPYPRRIRFLLNDVHIWHEFRQKVEEQQIKHSGFLTLTCRPRMASFWAMMFPRQYFLI